MAATENDTGVAGLAMDGEKICELEKETPLTNGGDVETLGAIEREISASGDAPSSKEEYQRDITPKRGTDESGEVDPKLNTEPNKDDQPNTVIDKDVSEETNRQDKVIEKEDEDPEWTDILGTGHLKKKVLCEGKGMDTRPERGRLVTIKSKGKLPDGTEVDCHNEIQFVLGDGDVVQAWDISVSLMQLGEQAVIKSTPRFAYGEVGRPDDIPPNTDITYELELLKVEDRPNLETLSPEECCTMADTKREHGNNLYSRKEYSNAINSYSKALDILKEIRLSALSDDSKKTLDELNVKCYNNLAAAQLKVDAPLAALKSCNAVLDVQPKNVKALFRKGKVLANQGEYKEAVTIMKEALALEPTNKTIHQELSKLTARQAEQRQSEKELYQRMVGDIANVAKLPLDPNIKDEKFAIIKANPALACLSAKYAERHGYKWKGRRPWLYALSVGVMAGAIILGVIFASDI